MKNVIISGIFDQVRGGNLRFIEEAACLGPLTICLWSDAAIAAQTGHAPKFSESEREYLVGAVRYVDRLVRSGPTIDPDALPENLPVPPDLWVVDEAADTPAKRTHCRARGIDYRVLRTAELSGFPAPSPMPSAPGRKKVIVTGCYDWFHSGHVRFFEEVAEHGDLYVVVGNDANVAHLKGKGHPMFREDERRYIAGSIRFVKQCLISTGMGWMDAEPEIARLRPDIYAVNEDGDKPEKRAFCAAHGLEYLVLKRAPKPGLPRRSSTDLRGF